jgi:hypothetical protein
MRILAVSYYKSNSEKEFFHRPKKSCSLPTEKLLHGYVENIANAEQCGDDGFHL